MEDLYPRTVRFAEETPDRYALTVSTVQRLTLTCDALLGICFITISLSCDLPAIHCCLHAAACRTTTMLRRRGGSASKVAPRQMGAFGVTMLLEQYPRGLAPRPLSETP